MLERLMKESREQALSELTQLEERLELDEYKNRIEELKKQIEWAEAGESNNSSTHSITEPNYNIDNGLLS